MDKLIYERKHNSRDSGGCDDDVLTAMWRKGGEMKEIELSIEYADNGAIIRFPDDEGCEYVNVVEGGDDLIAKKVGEFVTSQMEYDVESKAKIKIQMEYEDTQRGY